MDPVIEQAEFERQQDEEFWENKRRDEQQTRRARSQPGAVVEDGAAQV